MEDVSEIESRILAELEEAGSENIPALMNTVMVSIGAEQEATLTQQAIRNLLASKFVTLRMSSIPKGNEPKTSDKAFAIIDELKAHLKYVNSEQHWTDERMAGPPFFQNPVPEIVLTDTGLLRSRSILNERGYQWWRQKA